MKPKFTSIVAAAMLFSLCVNAQTSWQITGNSNITTNNFIGTTNNTAFKIRTNNAVRMTISNAGSVGIGTTNPNAKLDVAGTILGLDSYFGSRYPVSAGTSGASYSSVGYGLTFSDTTANYRYRINNDYSSMLEFRTGGFVFNTAPIGTAGNVIPYTAVMAILQNGRVGIGTIAPASILDVKGDALINGLTIGRGSGAVASNTAVGNQALPVNTFTDANTAIGNAAQFRNTDGRGNTAVGYFALDWNVHGSYNTAVGSHINTIISAQSWDNNTTLGSSVFVNANNIARIGNASVTSIGGQVGWTSFSDERIKDNIQENVPGLKFINLLKPVTYHFNLSKENKLMNSNNDADKWRGKYDIEKNTYSGFLAQEVNKAAKSIHYDFSGVDTAGGVWGLRYAEFVVPLVKAVQELSKMNDEKNAKIDNLQKQIDQLKAMLISQNKKDILDTNQTAFNK